MVQSIVTTVGSAARGAASVTASVARHATWYVRYKVEGNSRAQAAPPPDKRSSTRR